MDYLKSSEQVRSDEIYVIGWSQGGLVAAAIAGRGADLDAVALWAAVADAKRTFRGLLGDEAMARGRASAAHQAVAVKLPWGLEVELNGAFFDGVDAIRPLTEIAHYPGPLLVAQGSKDTIVSPSSADLLIAAHVGPEQLWKADMDHVFNVFQTSRMLDELVAVTVKFFMDHDD